MSGPPQCGNQQHASRYPEGKTEWCRVVTCGNEGAVQAMQGTPKLRYVKVMQGKTKQIHKS